MMAPFKKERHCLLKTLKTNINAKHRSKNARYNAVNVKPKLEMVTAQTLPACGKTKNFKQYKGIS